MKLIFTLILPLFFSIACATPADDLAGMLNSVHTMKANFTQTIYDNRNKAVQQSYGRMSMQRPGKFRWEVTKPIPQLVIANDTRLWIYDPDLEQVTIRSLKKAAGETPALLLSDVDSVLNNAYDVKPLAQKNNDSVSYVLTPKSADNMFASIKMFFSNGQVREMQLVDHLGHVTSVKFQQIESNVTLPASLFVFKKPARVDVIDETTR